MSEAFIGEISLFPYQYSPKNWMYCDGSELDISQFQTLYAIIFNIYGGDMLSTFCIPNLQGRVPVGCGSADGLTPYKEPGITNGDAGLALTTKEIPEHTHALYGASLGAGDYMPGTDSTFGIMQEKPDSIINAYKSIRKSDSLVAMSDQSIETLNGGNSHQNMQPYIAMNYCICLDGLFPGRKS